MTKPVVALISCCSQKQNHPTEAIDLYTSPLFRKSRAFAEKFGLPVWILSAKHKLTAPKTIIAPYDVTLNDFTKQQLDEWSKEVAGQIVHQFGNEPLLVLAGEKYLGFKKYLNNPIVDPMQGLPIGKRLKWLKRMLDK